MRCKIIRFQKLMWRNMMKSIKSQKASVLHYSIDLPQIRVSQKACYKYVKENVICSLPILYIL